MTHRPDNTGTITLCLALLLWTCGSGGEARVRLNAIKTVILQEGHVLPVNRSSWEPSVDLTVSQCFL